MGKHQPWLTWHKAWSPELWWLSPLAVTEQKTMTWASQYWHWQCLGPRGQPSSWHDPAQGGGGYTVDKRAPGAVSTWGWGDAMEEEASLTHPRGSSGWLSGCSSGSQWSLSTWQTFTEPTTHTAARAGRGLVCLSNKWGGRYTTPDYKARRTRQFTPAWGFSPSRLWLGGVENAHNLSSSSPLADGCQETWSWAPVLPAHWLGDLRRMLSLWPGFPPEP